MTEHVKLKSTLIASMLGLMASSMPVQFFNAYRTKSIAQRRQYQVMVNDASPLEIAAWNKAVNDKRKLRTERRSLRT